MINPGSVALRFEVLKTVSGRCRVKVRSVFVTKTIDLGPIGQFAEIRTGERDRRPYFHRYEAAPVVCDVRELLPLAWLVNLSPGLACVPPSPMRAA